VTTEDNKEQTKVVPQYVTSFLASTLHSGTLGFNLAEGGR
jgi:hypothetical protein